MHLPFAHCTLCTPLTQSHLKLPEYKYPLNISVFSGPSKPNGSDTVLWLNLQPKWNLPKDNFKMPLSISMTQGFVVFLAFCYFACLFLAFFILYLIFESWQSDGPDDESQIEDIIRAGPFAQANWLPKPQAVSHSGPICVNEIQCDSNSYYRAPKKKIRTNSGHMNHVNNRHQHTPIITVWDSKKTKV